jgi:hypothetical protein
MDNGCPEGDATLTAVPGELLSRHRCLIYQGSPSHQLRAIAAVTREKLAQNYRCLYLNTAPMVAGLRSYLAAAGVDVTNVVGNGNLLLSSEQTHLSKGRFDVDRMIRALKDTFDQAMADGYAGLWASGDMTWELGPEKDFTKLLEYEWRLEQFFLEHPQFSGICQYHSDTLPPGVISQGFRSHQTIFISETLSILNSAYLPPRTSVATKKPATDCLAQSG